MRVKTRLLACLERSSFLILPRKIKSINKFEGNTFFSDFPLQFSVTCARKCVCFAWNCRRHDLAPTPRNSIFSAFWSELRWKVRRSCSVKDSCWNSMYGFRRSPRQQLAIAFLFSWWYEDGRPNRYRSLWKIDIWNRLCWSIIRIRVNISICQIY